MSIASNHGAVFPVLRTHASLMKQVSSGRPVQILIVDDDASVMKFLDRVLHDAGYRTALAADGAEALNTAQMCGPFDLVITDLRMPWITGDEVAAQLCLAHPGLKVLYLTGYSDQLFDTKTELQEHEAFLEKPCSVSGLLEAVSQLIWAHTHPEAPLAV